MQQIEQTEEWLLGTKSIMIPIYHDLKVTPSC